MLGRAFQYLFKLTSELAVAEGAIAPKSSIASMRSQLLSEKG